MHKPQNAEGQTQALVRAEIVIPPSLPNGSPHITRIVITARNVEELLLKMERGHELTFERRAHMWYGAIRVLNPQTGQYEIADSCDAVRAVVQTVLVGTWRFIWSLR